MMIVIFMNEPKYPISWWKKINPLWWFGNYDDPVDKLHDDGTPRHETFYPNKPLWIRKILWGIRNPLNNFTFYVIGLEDRKDLVNIGNLDPKEGQKWNIILPFLCYKGKKKEFYIGWRDGLKFGIAFRSINSKGM